MRGTGLRAPVCRGEEQAGPRRRGRRLAGNLVLRMTGQRESKGGLPAPVGPHERGTFAGSTFRLIPLSISLPATRQRSRRCGGLPTWNSLTMDARARERAVHIVAERLLESQGETLLSRSVRATITPKMHVDRFFQTTRGKIVSELRRRGSASAADLARSFELSPNAVRQQLMVLERDGLVAEKSVRRGPTKPTYEFSLTSEADKLFPQGYDKMLTAVLREVRHQFGTAPSSAFSRAFAARDRARPLRGDGEEPEEPRRSAYGDVAQKRRRRRV